MHGPDVPLSNCSPQVPLFWPRTSLIFLSHCRWSKSTSNLAAISIHILLNSLNNIELQSDLLTYWYDPIKINYIKTNLLTLWRRNFLLNFSTSVFKMWIIQGPKKVALWNKRHFEEKKKRRLCSMFKIFSTCICWINI